MKQICILPEGLYGSFRAGNVPDYPNPSSVNCLGVVRRDEKTHNGFVWTNMRIGARGDLGGVILELISHNNGQEGVVFADNAARDFMLNRHGGYFRPY